MEISTVCLGGAQSWNQLCIDRSGFQRRFTDLLLATPGLKGRVLDIGCGGDLPRALSVLRGHFGSLDGCDPDSIVLKHPLLHQRWHGCFETSAVPADSYDMAYAYNVLEHVAIPEPFFEKVCACLKSNGVFWGLTPNANHPFAVLSRLIEVMGLKGLARETIGPDEAGVMTVNDYPAYYRCNSRGSVIHATRGLGFRRACFYYCPCLQWDTYFPRFLRGVPKTYDFLIGTRSSFLMQIFMIRLEKE